MASRAGVEGEGKMTVSLYEHIGNEADDIMETANEQRSVCRFMLRAESVPAGIDWRLIRSMRERWQSRIQEMGE